MKPPNPPTFSQMEADDRKPDNIGPYVLQSTLGSGTSSKVKLAVHSETGQLVAIKIVSHSTLTQKPGLEAKVHREISLMKIVNHPNILRLIEVFESPTHLFIVLEYAERGQLFDYLVSRSSLSEDLALDFFRQITFGLEYLHAHGICHRDLKPENILLDGANRIKIADFGFARWVRRDVAETSCGSPHYAAPEVIRGVHYDGRRADIWSLGVILYALLAGYLPFDDPSIRTLLHKVKRGVFEMPPFRDDIAAVIRRMLMMDPIQRATIEEIKRSPCFLNGFCPEYRLPEPIPFPKYSTMIKPEFLTENVMDVLKQIGFGDEEEVKSDLREEGWTMAKAFVAMLTDQLDLDQLPWEVGEDSPRELFEKGRVSITAWVMVDEIRLPKVSISDAMYRVQQAVGDCGLQFFHPDPVTVYIRKSDRRFYVSIKASFGTDEELIITVRMHRGSGDQFEDFRDRLWQVFRDQLREIS